MGSGIYSINSSTALELRRRAVEREKLLRDTIKTIERDDTSSDSFKRQRVEQERARYAADLAALQSEAESTLTVRGKKVAQRLGELKQAETEHRRQVLGDSVLVEIYRQRLALLAPDEIVTFVGEASGEWESMLLDELADLELSQRAQSATGEAGEDVGRALFALRDKANSATPERTERAELEHELRELTNIPRFVQALDVGAERVEFATTYNFNPANVVFPE